MTHSEKIETRTGLRASGRGAKTNLGEGGAFSITQIKIGKPAGIEAGRGTVEEHTCKYLRRQNSMTGPYSSLCLDGIGVSSLLSTIAG